MRIKQKLPESSECAGTKCALPSTIIVTVDAQCFGLCDRHWRQRCEEQESQHVLPCDEEPQLAAPRAQRKKRKIVTALVTHDTLHARTGRPRMRTTR